MLFASLFKSIIERNVLVKIELKNGIELSGTLTYVDNNMNYHIINVTVSDTEKYPQLMSLKSCFVRGSTIRYVQLPPNEVDIELLQDACLKELKNEKYK